MQDWFQWGYNGYSGDEMRRMMARANDDGHESDDDDHLLGERDDAARHHGALRRTRRRAEASEDDDELSSDEGSNGSRSGSSTSHTDFDERADIVRKRAAKQTKRRWRRAAPAPRVVAAIAPLAVRAMPPALCGHAAVSHTFADGTTVAIIHGGAGTSLDDRQARQIFRVGGGFTRGVLKTQAAVYATTQGNHSVEPAPFARFDTYDGPAFGLYGHNAVVVNASVSTLNSDNERAYTLSNLIIFGGARDHLESFHDGRGSVVSARLLTLEVRTVSPSQQNTDSQGSVTATQWSVPRWQWIAVSGTEPPSRVFSASVLFQRGKAPVALLSASSTAATPTPLVGDSESDTHVSALVFGGLSGDSKPLGDLLEMTYFHDALAVKFKSLEDRAGGYAPPPRYGHSMTAIPATEFGGSEKGCGSNRFVVCGGMGEGGRYFNDCYLLEHTMMGNSFLWREVLLPCAPLRVPTRAFHYATWLHALQCVIFFGGEVNGMPCDTHWTFRPRDERWAPVRTGAIVASPGALPVAVPFQDNARTRLVLVGGLNSQLLRNAAAGTDPVRVGGCRGQRLTFSTSLKFFAAAFLAQIMEP
jgi:hypothetical protein